MQRPEPESPNPRHRCDASTPFDQKDLYEGVQGNDAARGAHGANTAVKSVEPTPSELLAEAGGKNTNLKYCDAEEVLRHVFAGEPFSPSNVMIPKDEPESRKAYYDALNEAAIMYVGSGRAALAVPLYLENLRDCRKRAEKDEQAGRLDDASAERDGERAQNQNLAEAYLQLEDYKRAEEAAKEALRLSNDAEDGLNQLDSHILLGTAQRRAGKIGEAEASFAEAIELEKTHEGATWVEMLREGIDALRQEHRTVR